ncbi:MULTISPECIES: TetR/AcrR family transcriptional regulator [unclassified Mycolicibacterium]|uniref:TetR/AcrR family transcriptional regulator n=1 Tax=unclassified Mycolicibacterium TaxID=2636767 RepID=UPI0012DC778C|nr:MULTISPECIES: TetR/AcrR family transcriptional regulator [unclassified Mycolicibacterium]MUL81388.1 TetR/AcrR family transcriptional regulator [Mycolicibacterium sp. CBMA 329]MUL87154.1 TetR/AcrR family transcriptional regulator [Mycolicibacterium sp. CBMA 331]MUL98564.1 TetR/AcrR family transcriptional regulator [Mycolicibacterium sp. CBMA 334]MUM28299.1 TetR/AcrR family transcriptional regulator [Mycolicibacterium sp. CBMA 295]MUM37451.1 TetR/AcrR family transcriptional regulator [Mycolic
MTTPVGRGRPRDAGADRAILQAALDLFIERGVEGSSIEQIAKRAGVGKPTIYRRWSTKEELIAAAMETLIAEEVGWASPEAIDLESPYELVEAAIESAAVTTTTPHYRALVARVFGSAVSHPALMAVYWDRYILPRRELAARLLERARERGTVAADTDFDVAIDMMVGAITYRVLQPHPPGTDEMRRYLRAVYRQVGLLP